MFQSGFVNIIGRPNVGKSTLMNALLGERMSIITNKPQTTRHRIIGILSDENYQMVFSDTPGIIRKPAYKMHAAMNAFAKSTFEDSDVMLFVTEPTEIYEADDPIIRDLRGSSAPVFLLINKTDTATPEAVATLTAQWLERVPFKETLGISALNKVGMDDMIAHILKYLPEGPEYYPKDQLTDRPERFFVSEIIREKILLNYREEIPYACEVMIDSYQETQTNDGTPIARIFATIYVARDTQKSIVVGKNGTAIKKVGMEARKDIEIFIESKAHLELTVKVRENWRDDERLLKNFGYTS
jgi:GTP-binding protein Era